MDPSTVRAARITRFAWTSPALRAALGLALGGTAFALANLILARTLPKEQYGRFSLVLAITMVGILTGPIGANVIVNLHPFDPGPRLLGRTLATSAVVGLGLAIGAALLYRLDGRMLVAMGVAIVAGALKLVAVGHYQSRRRFGFSLFLSESTNLALLLAAAVAFAVAVRTALLPFALFAAGLSVAAAFGWQTVTRDRAQLGYPDPPFPWGEAVSVVGFVSAGMVLMALERLVTPRLLGLPALATLSVLATLAGSPFQMLNQGVGFALLPSLRGAAGAAERRRVLAQESAIVLIACAVAAILVWWLTPIALRLVLDGRYELSRELIFAAIAVGALKPAGSVAVATVNAVGSSKALAVLSGIAWASVGVGLVGTWIGAQWGLVGLLYGVGAGWLLRAVACSWLAARCLRAVSGGTQLTEPLAAGLAEE